MRTFFDGTHLRDVDHLIKNIRIKNSIVTGTINDIPIQFHAYEGCIPLIADEMKELFGLKKIGKNSCIFADTQSMIVRIHGKKRILESYDGEITLSMKEEIQKIYIFRWCLGLKNNDDRALAIIEQCGNSFITSIKDKKVDYNVSKIPDTIIKRWFDNDQDKIKYLLKDRFEDIMPFNLRSKIESIIKRIDPDEIYWTHQILSRVYSF